MGWTSGGGGFTQSPEVCAARFQTEVKAKDVAGDYIQLYSNGYNDATSVACSGAMTYRGKKLSVGLAAYPANSGVPAERAKQNSDPNNVAETSSRGTGPARGNPSSLRTTS